MTATRRHLLCAAIVLAAFAAYAQAFGSFQVGVYEDDAEYVVLARSLAQGHGLRLVSYPHAPPVTRYPPGYPLMLAPLVLAFRGELAPLQALSVAATLASLLLAYWLYRAQGCDDALTAAAVALFALNPIVVAHSGMVMSEAVNLALTLAALLALRAGQGRRVALAALSGALSGLAVLTRLSSAPLLAAAGLYLLVGRRYRHLAAFALCAAAILLPYMGYGLHTWRVPVSPLYFHQLRWEGEFGNLGVTDVASLLGRLWATGAYYLTEAIPSSLLPIAAGPRAMGILRALGLGWGWTLGSVTLAAVMALGWYLTTPRRAHGPEGAFVVLYLAMILAWPWHLARLLYPVLPFLCLYLCAGARRIVQWAARAVVRRVRLTAWRPETALALVVVPLLLLEGAQLARMSLGREVQHAPDLRRGAEWIAHHAPASAVVMCVKPISRHLYADRLTVDMACSEAEAIPLLLADDAPVDYVLIAPQLVWSSALLDDPCAVGVIEPLLRARPERFVLVHEEPEHRVRVYARCAVGGEARR